MAFEFRLPDIGEGVVEGEVVRWMVKVGDEIREDQPMVEVMTDKATVEIPSPKAGRILSILAPEGKTCAVGQVMVTIDAGGGVPAVATRETTAKLAPSGVARPPMAGTAKVLATPATRKLARDLGVSIEHITPSGPSGRVTHADVHAASGVATALASPAMALRVMPDDERRPLRGLRKKIAENMARSKRSAAHFTYVDECDATELVVLRQRAKARAEERSVRLSFLPFIVKAVVAGLKRHPVLNASLDEARGEIVLRKSYHIGIAAAAEEGLVVPVVKDADRKSLFELGREIEDLTERAKTGKATRDEMTGSTFTISSLGALGGLLATPIINPPEVAILGVHKIQPRPVVREGQIVVRDIMNLSLSLDHRVVDGYEGARFLEQVIALLADPALLFLELV